MTAAISQRICIADRIAPDIGICVDSRRKSNRIALDIPPGARVIIPVIVVVQRRFPAEELAWEQRSQLIYVFEIRFAGSPEEIIFLT